MKRVLWIEDNAKVDMGVYFGPIFTSGRYDVSIALDPSEALRKISLAEYQAIIVDIRLAPGQDKLWRDLYVGFGASKPTARLGIHLVQSLLKVSEAKIKLPLKDVPCWINPRKIGFLKHSPTLAKEVAPLA